MILQSHSQEFGEKTLRSVVDSGAIGVLVGRFIAQLQLHYNIIQAQPQSLLNN